MTEKVIDIVVNTDKAEKPTDELKLSFDRLADSMEKSNELAEKGLEKTGKAAKKAKKGVGGLSGGFKKLGVAIAATGIGLVVSIFVALGAALSKNQKVMNAVNTVFETMGIVLSQVATVLVNVYESVAKSSENFDGLGKVMLGLLNLAVTPLKLAFYGIKLAIQQGQLAWEKSFFGGNDKGKIKELTLGITETQKSIIETSEKAVQAGKDVYNNFSDAVGEIGNITTKVSEEISKISVKAAFEQAKVNTELKNSAILAVAQQSLLVEKYDTLAEKQRKLRDDVFADVEDRKKASKELLSILDKQEEAMLAGANAQISAANAQFRKTGLIEDEAALIDAIANKESVRAQITGFRTEQFEQNNALLKEEIMLSETLTDSQKQRQLDQLEFEASQTVDPEEKLEKQKELLDAENEIILEDLLRKRELYKEGTQSRIDAEVEFANKKQELDQKQVVLDKQISDKKISISKKAEGEKWKLANQSIQLIGSLVDKGSIAGKGIALAEVGIDTARGISKSLADNPPPSPIGIIGAALVGASGIAQTIAIHKQKIPSATGSGSIGGGGGASQAPAAPSFNLVQGTPENQIAESIGASNETPVNAIVVSSSVTTAQEADRNRVEESSI